MKLQVTRYKLQEKLSPSYEMENGQRIMDNYPLSIINYQLNMGRAVSNSKLTAHNLLLTVLFFLSVNLLFGQSLNITYPRSVDSFPGQTVNIPIICENITGQTLSIQPDYVSINPPLPHPLPTYIRGDQGAIRSADDTQSGRFPYRINRVAPRIIQPAQRELIFLSLTPDSDMLAGKRYFPFVIKDDRDRVLSSGVIEINHIIQEDFAVVPLDDYRYIVPNENMGLNYLLINKGTVPVEFKIDNLETQTSSLLQDYYFPLPRPEIIIQPTQVDTLFIPFSEITNFVQTEFWISFSVDYTLTKILPDALIPENHSIRRVIPIAHKTDYPFKREFYQVPVNFSQSFLFDESKYSQRNYIRQYVTNIQGNGFIDDFPSPYLNFHANYRHTDYGFRSDNDFYYYFNLRSNSFNLAYGENSYVLDLQNFPRYGMGLDLAYFNRGFFLERVFLKELYGEKAIHNSTSLGYSWDAETFLFEPEQYVRFNYYQKNNRDAQGNWVDEDGSDPDFGTLFNRWFVKSEHEKFILDAQIRLMRNLNMNFEVYTTRENETQDFSSVAFSGGLFFNSRYILNRFTMHYDDLHTINEIPRRIHYDNDLSFQSNRLDIYTTVRYRDEYSRLGSGFTDRYITHNISGNVYLLLANDFYLRFRMYDTATNMRSAIPTNYSEYEYLYGMMLKRPSVEYELLYGNRKKQLNDEHPNLDNIISFNAWFSRWDNTLDASWSNINLSLFFNSRAEFDKDEFNITNQANIFNRWTNSFHQSLGVYHVYNDDDDWRNNLLLFTNFYFNLPWKHQFNLGGSYNVNPSFSKQYRYSIFAEYSIPFDFKFLPKSNKKYMTLTFLDHWQRKPVRGAVFEMDNTYLVSNDAGVIRTKRDDFNPHSINIVNIPPGFTLVPDLSTLTDFKGHQATFRFAELGRVNINVQKQTYQRISPADIDRYDNIAYYQNTLINLDNHVLSGYTQSLEIMLRNIDTNTITQRATINQQGQVTFNGLAAGRYEILINDSFTQDDLILDTFIFNLSTGENSDIEIIVKERFTLFQRFE